MHRIFGPDVAVLSGDFLFAHVTWRWKKAAKIWEKSGEIQSRTARARGKSGQVWLALGSLGWSWVQVKTVDAVLTI
jgi:hypothetical protein